MLPETLAALAAAGGTAFVEAMATDSWQSVKHQVVAFFARHGDAGRTATIEQALDADAQVVAEIGETERSQVRQELLPRWQGQLSRLLAENPAARTALQALITEIGTDGPSGKQTVNLVAGRDGYVNIQGNQTVTNHRGRHRR
ncbi:hypothetical protein [Amycolatopsis magusensis]|uniref:hypothetical protein n=1 Tax=Amycolatopsis magusensis TaxID=882444 RepID=UPI003797827C